MSSTQQQGTKISYVIGDATVPQLAKGEEKFAIIHCVNNICAWGSGFVIALSRRFPGVEKSYLDPCRDYRNKGIGAGRHFPLGMVIPAPITDDEGRAGVILHLFGQQGVRSKGDPHPIRYKAIREGFAILESIIHKGKFNSLHMPRIGCGLAGGTWDEIERIIKNANLSVPVYVYDLNERDRRIHREAAIRNIRRKCWQLMMDKPITRVPEKGEEVPDLFMLPPNHKDLMELAEQKIKEQEREKRSRKR